MKGIKEVLQAELQNIKPSDAEVSQIKEIIRNFLSLVKPELKKAKADIIVGGSFAKNTVIKKRNYDVDFFVRFDSEKKDISEILEKVLNKISKNIHAKPKLNIEKIHGSRDYFSIRFLQLPFDVSFEIVPVLRVSNAKDAKNVTDASPLHVFYIEKKIRKNKSLADDIRLAKAFCYAQNCYGAESYINGFSGYALELLTCHYGSFLNLLKSASKWNTNEKIIIDSEKFYKNKDALKKLNKAKLQSPLILIDPTQPERNAAASLNYECLGKFIKSCKSFLSHPDGKFFKKTDSHIDIQKIKDEAKSKKAEFLILEVNSSKQREDVAGAKLLKYFNFILRQLNADFSVLKSEWAFDEDKMNAVYAFIFRKKEILVRGPPITLEKHAKAFRKKWKNSFVKKGILYSIRKSGDIGTMLKIQDIKKSGIKNIRKLK